MGTWADFIRNLITANIITGRKNKAADLRVVYSGIADAVQFLEGLQRGAAILNGVGAPDAALGLNGDAYIDTAVSDMFLKVNGAWTLRLVLRGQNGKSSYQSWLDAGNTGSEAAFVLSLRGQNGKSAYQSWLAAGNTGTEADFAGQLKGSKGDNGKSAYQLWTDAGNVGTLAEFLASLPGEDGARGARITASSVAPAIDGVISSGGLVDGTVPQQLADTTPGDLHIQTLSAERFRLWYNDRGTWQTLYTTPVGATVADGSVTNDKLAADVKVGSLAAARNAYPQADRSSLTTVETYLVWIGTKIQDLYTRLASVDSLTNLVNAFNGRITALETWRASGGGGTSSGGTGTANYPAQSTATAGKFLKSTGTAGQEMWDAVTNNRVGWILTFKNEISRNQRFFKNTGITRIEIDAGISTLSYSVNGATAVNVVFTNRVFVPASALTFPAGSLITWAITYNANFTEAAFEVEGTETV